nr:hypothetical protein [Thermoleophilaceae bacterium]
MSKKLLYTVLTATLLAAAVVATVLPASAQLGGVTDILCPVNGQLMSEAECQALQDELDDVVPGGGGGGGSGGGGGGGGGGTVPV